MMGVTCLAGKSREIPLKIGHYLLGGTPWWSVNLCDNWAFNVWTVNFIKTPTTINTHVNYNMVCLSGKVCVLWLAEAFTAIHTPDDTANHGYFTPSYLICRPSMCFSARQDMLANQFCMYTTCKLCTIVGELPSSPMEGN